MRIGIVADVHCRHDALREAAEQMTRGGVAEILLAGDAHNQYRFSSETVDVMREYGMRCVAGNHEAVLLGPHGSRALDAPHVRAADVAYMREIPDRLTTTIGGRRLTMLHADPFARTYDYLYADDPRFDRCDELDTDVLVLGHTHVPMVARFGRTLVVNPGALMLSRDPGGHGVLTYAVLDTGSDDVFVVRDGVGWDDPVRPVERSSRPT
ncbi:MAG: putative metallo-dependent phosphatase [Blastococcus sp.]|nr:putative metallo-dependent phosphatase [Blastococcus sp.]